MGRYLNDVYTEAKEEKIEWTVKTDDFWAYNWKSYRGAYWTGYFSTGPEIKQQIKHYSDFVHASMQIMGTAMSPLSESTQLES